MHLIHYFFKKSKEPSPAIRYINVDECDSTNNYVKSLLATDDGVAPRPEMVVVAAKYQRAGRGQGSNHWVSDPGKNLLFSILCHPTWLPVRDQFSLSKAIAVAIWDNLATYCKDGLSIKWPNDIYYNDKKLAGILIENTISGGHIENCIVGIGINVNQQEFPSSIPNPVSISQICGSEQVPDIIGTLLKAIVSSFSGYLSDFRGGDYQKIASLYQSRLYRSSGFHPFRDKDGDFEAAIIEVEDDGTLVLRDRQDGIRTYAFKEVEFII